MWYLELMLSILILASVSSYAYIYDLATEEERVNAEAVKIVSQLERVRIMSRSSNGDSINWPTLYVYRDKYYVYGVGRGRALCYKLPSSIHLSYNSEPQIRMSSLLGSCHPVTIIVSGNRYYRQIRIDRIGRINME